ncbi:YqaI family protein [Bacillus chungangensis]|uniref:YqaI-like protein n=1 Tax=Bacillus chungangensis TaxID=587633 RepID=A0ABT9WRV5_9BACI|nr:hypothetical protein [Bacillus chungangensis]MDQ0176032.1 hypothetical protein [Bacillus chungangensis]
MSFDIEHPMIGEINRNGYPDMYQEKYWGIDYFGEEIMEGDDIVEIDGETILSENLERFLYEEYDAKFTTAE